MTQAGKQRGRTVAITGAGSGLGRELALGFSAKGYKVFGTALSESEKNLFASDGNDINLTITDITKEEEVNNWKEQVSKLLNGDELDLLINNAGVLTPGPMEVLPLSAVRREFEINVFGSLATIHAFLPLLRQSKGRIVQIGSMTGHFPVPFSGPSSASKAAMEAFADVYRTELKPFGINFIMVQPGNMLTGGPAKTAALLKQVSEKMTVEQKNLYGEYFDQFAAALDKMQASGLPASEAAARVIEISEQVPAPIRAPVGKDAEEILWAVRERSDEELDLMRAEIFGYDRIKGGANYARIS
jgi:NAD(P)-dependent dehydrogenase (short-subunit alcohol dehydrogenase family)